MKATFLFLAVLGLVAVLSLGHAAAKDNALRFLHLMQEQGFGNVAIEYLDELKSEPNPPAEIIRLWDLEMSKSKQAAAKIAYNDAAKKQLTDDAKSLMEKFVKAHPDLPEAIEAADPVGVATGHPGPIRRPSHRSITDKAEQSAALEKARKIFSEVRPRLAQAGTPPLSSARRFPRGLRSGKNKRPLCGWARHACGWRWSISTRL